MLLSAGEQTGVFMNTNTAIECQKLFVYYSEEEANM